ncbi:general secretion pathway protein K [Pseudomonas sp. M47T1]|uniref:type II secretion system protein GspK n=1 Tax=Pseudomonas sp. M47T1 TaxID=1179778 RepID=UPI00026078FD|nr:type II secretion system protein GspK [Pseudomonas sp. M47T1]EIK94456.1 general secretion pathway protein K [Pseudomonas sp. M47T1]
MKGQQGVALLLVLWVLAVLSTLLAGLAGTVQLQQRQAGWQAAHVRALLAAEAGLSQAAISLQARDLKARWAANGQPHALTFDQAQVAVSVRSERGKLDLNAASQADVDRLLRACGAAPSVAEAIAQALQQQRDGSTPLRALEEFRELPGMSAALYRRVLPLVTVWSGQAQPDPSLAPPRLARALGLPTVRTPNPDAGQILTVTSEARLPGGVHAQVRVTLMMTLAKEGARPYRVLRWQE